MKLTMMLLALPMAAVAAPNSAADAYKHVLGRLWARVTNGLSATVCAPPTLYSTGATTPHHILYSGAYRAAVDSCPRCYARDDLLPVLAASFGIEGLLEAGLSHSDAARAHERWTADTRVIDDYVSTCAACAESPSATVFQYTFTEDPALAARSRERAAGELERVQCVRSEMLAAQALKGGRVLRAQFSNQRTQPGTTTPTTSTSRERTANENEYAWYVVP